MAKRLSFEKSLETLENIVEELESGDLTLDEALERYERGVAAHEECRKILAAAEKRIETLVKRADGALETQPFEGEQEAGQTDGGAKAEPDEDEDRPR